MISFDTYQEIAEKYPISGEASQVHTAQMGHVHVMTKADLVIARAANPKGYYNKATCEWCYWYITSTQWYDSYVFDGEKWWLGTNTWDGIVDAKEPGWGLYRDTYSLRYYKVCKTKAEAEEFVESEIRDLLSF